MAEIDFEKIGLKVGLEIHQQLNTNKKLFCKCRPIESDEYTEKFSRRLRTAKSELGELDPAALFEKTKSKKISYYANSQSSCLVEKDEEPPHDLDYDAKKISLLISCMLESKIFSEIHVMRKTVIDGSNTAGFQRTMLVSQGGNLNVNGKKIGVQAICLEEDAAKLLKDEQDQRNYSLDRLGIPLVEIALEPVTAKPTEVKEIALTLGRLLRVTGMVKRGIGSIRQDVNISVMNSGVVEVKGVQQLDQLEKIIDYEAKRQYGLILIAEKLKKLSITISKEDVFDITEVFKDCESKIIQNALKLKIKIKAILVRNFSGMFGFEPYPGIRLGKEIGQLVRFFGVGGVFHSDELPNYGINDSDVDNVKKYLKLVDGDGFLIIAGEDSKLDYAIDSIINRIKDATQGVPAETRGATQDGETIFLRPRPGASRMYPETDIPSISVLPEEIKLAKENIPKSWNDSIAEIQQKYSLNSQLSEQIFDSEYLELFEKICKNKKNSPNFVASILCSSITNLQRKGFDAILLKPEHVIESFELLASDKIPKESLEIIFESIMSGKSENVSIAMQSTDVSSMGEDELNDILDKIIQNNMDLVKERGENALVTLMGIAMKEVRGKASGKMVNALLRKKILEF
ncbi:Glu-tRNA(Gln) amidotransferase subunit GatE [Marine Group I thaumarchaeote]|uniref:Glutamyl-tRNA(Gln) amidotransferase subunit E n=1 Tax=Marine Group I thaumarchaeote TaxID=2511932 RepID=A0A7K4NKM2_9ARCH|nr:Glu-tRNA(Gln) amidotransferase subunit GatE [Marine Group I thaumarchaeote]